VRLIGADGEQLGIVEINDALKRAQEADLDLVEVAPGSKPPVTRLLDYSKYKYEQEQKQKQARKHQQQVNIREIKLRPKIAIHDYETKKGHVERFLKHHDKVKVTIMFRGREQAHPERGRALLQKLFEDLGGIAVVESAPLQEGRNMSMLLAPSKEVDKLDEAAPNGDAPTADAAPVSVDATPATDDAAPADDATPVADDDAPATDAATPVADDAAPAEDAAPAAAEAPAAEAADETPADAPADAPADD
jgi:translation initiation factor IF-3